MTTLHKAAISHPMGAEADVSLEVTDGVLQHRMVCKSCERVNIIEATTPEKDSKAVMKWLAGHVHKK